jgi:hypothetical protein
MVVCMSHGFLLPSQGLPQIDEAKSAGPESRAVMANPAGAAGGVRAGH